MGGIRSMTTIRHTDHQDANDIFSSSTYSLPFLPLGFLFISEVGSRHPEVMGVIACSCLFTFATDDLGSRYSSGSCLDVRH